MVFFSVPTLHDMCPWHAIEPPKEDQHNI